MAPTCRTPAGPRPRGRLLQIWSHVARGPVFPGPRVLGRARDTPIAWPPCPQGASFGAAVPAPRSAVVGARPSTASWLAGPLRPACRRVAVVGRPSRHSSAVLRAAPANPVRDVPTIPGGGVARSPRPQAPRAHCWRPGPLWSVPDHPLPAGSLARSGPRPAGWQTPSVRVVAPPTGLRAAPASPVCDVPTIPAGMSLGVRDLRPASRSPGGSPPGSSF